jgi:hypothetical protein
MSEHLIRGASILTAEAEVIRAAPTLPGSTDKVAIINESTVVQDADAQKWMAAVQFQADHHFRPAWGPTCRMSFYGKGQKPDPNMAWLAILDDSDQAGALGYHDLTDNGLPLGKVFAKTDLQYNEVISVTLSHELLELLADPYISYTMLTEGPAHTVMGYAWEVCDACEDDQFAYTIDGVEVSDFVYPAWFQPWRAPGSTRFDHCQKINQPFQLLPGGYIGVWTPQTGWTQLNADKVPTHKLRPKVGQRRERRATPLASWRLSDPRGG